MRRLRDIGILPWKGRGNGRSAGRDAALPHWSVVLEYALIALFLVQLVRFVWVVITPVGPLGDWQGKQAVIADAATRSGLLRGYDAFYPAAGNAGGAQNVTSLALKLYGVRINEGSGLGSAIIAGEDDVQNSYAVGDEIQPGVTLKSVLFDHVVISRNGADEMIFLDQSTPVESAQVASVSVDPAGGAGSSEGQPVADATGNKGPLTADVLRAGVGFGPRMSGRNLTGIVVTRKGPGFDAAGFRAGDIITHIGGRPISSASDLAGVQEALVPGARISVMVERGAQSVPLAILVQE